MPKDNSPGNEMVLPIAPGRARLTDGFWHQVLETVRSAAIPFVFTQCEREGRFENFLIAAGRAPGPVRGKMPFDDSDVYKFIEGASLTLLHAPDPRLSASLDRLIETIGAGQEPDGYLTTWFTIDAAHPSAPWAGNTSRRWIGEAGSHELYNSGHLFEAAVAHFRATGQSALLKIALKNADLLVTSFGPGKLSIPPGHQIVEQGLVSLYRLTANEAYLKLARYFLDLRGDASTHPLYREYAQDHAPVVRQREAVGHAVRAMYLFTGMTDYALLTGDSAYRRALRRLWQGLVSRKLYLTGGLGARHDHEALGERYELPNLTAYGETCAAIGSVSWNHRLFQLFPHGRYYDVIEYTLYNGLLAGIGLDGKSFFYVNPLESDGVFAFNHGASTRLPWFDCPCCPTNLIRFLPSLPGLLYAVRGDSVFVNLYAASRAEIDVDGNQVVIEQRTDYPWEGTIRLTIDCSRPVRFTLRVRLPGWIGSRPLPGGLYRYIDPCPGRPSLSINGEKIPVSNFRGYAPITREWRPGDTVEIDLPLAARRVTARRSVAADRGLAALTRGPLVYCAEGIDHDGRLDGLSLPHGVPWRIAPCDRLPGGILAITGNVLTAAGQRTLYAVPYYAWANRGPGTMKVWLPDS